MFTESDALLVAQLGLLLVALWLLVELERLPMDLVQRVLPLVRMERTERFEDEKDVD